MAPATAASIDTKGPMATAFTMPPPATPTYSHSRPKSSDRMSFHSRPGTAYSKRESEDDEFGTKTAVKVAVRVRPPLKPSDPGYDLIPTRFRNSTCSVTNPTALTVESAQGQKLFVFDRVFADSEDQESVWEYISDSVDSFMQGYNVSILAYGQSGAGKSYTMGTASLGEQEQNGSLGIIPRASNALFEKLMPSASSKGVNGSGLRAPKSYSSSGLPTGSQKGNEDKNWQLKATYVEIYNEQLRDLLVSDTVPPNERTSVTIREDTKGRIILTGLTQLTINSIEDLLNALNFGSSIRQTDATNINSKSSRSHAVFSLNLVQKKPRGWFGSGNSGDKRSSVQVEPQGDNLVTVDSKLHFVDLAGSERLKNSGLTGERVKEGISINAGLASLGKVISQLSSKSAGSHVSYRDSRLTRLLQDSLGGNAITYMVACVNPVEFHLSETLNTVQYAQRARNIQSRPQIQQRSDDADKQAIIDRLRSEIAFLRDQIRLADRGERRANSSRQERGTRNAERENELQNQLLDIQENYSALSQRHAKLMAQIAKEKGTEDGEELSMSAVQQALENSSLDRLKRSNNFAEAVENVVLEYEKTIQSLEGSLSSVRSTLATSENSLLEREAKIVYLEAVTQQLQSRIQKAIDREASNDNYVRDLEARIDGITGGEDKHLAIIQDLRKELIRIRESESSAEEYISTLEERLAEAEQDTEVMQREIARLEHIIQRQRSVGKLDNLLQELDSIRQEEIHEANGVQPSKDEHTPSDAFHDRLIATTAATNPNGEMLPEAAEEEWKGFGPMDDDDEGANESALDMESEDQVEGETTPKNLQVPKEKQREDKLQSPAQSRALADKLETITIELFDLKVEHESTVQELDDVQRKYQIALSTLAELQDAMEEVRSTKPSSQSFLAEDGRRYSSRVLSSSASSRGDSPTLVEASEAGTTHGDNTEPIKKDDSLVESIRRLKRANAEKDINMAELTESYSQLQDQHKDTLNYIEELKEEMQKAAQQQASAAKPIRHHRASQFSMGKDRETRVYATLHNLAAEHFESNPEVKDSFESNINTAASESQLRSERIQTLETELATLRKEMDTKNTMISGLTRERNARSSTSMPLDMSLVSTMRDQLAESQKQIAALQKANAAREAEFANEMGALKAAIKTPRPLSMLTTSKDIDTAKESSIAEDKGSAVVTKIADDVDVKAAEVEADVAHKETTNVESMESKANGDQNDVEQQPGAELTELEIAQKEQIEQLQKEIYEWESKQQNSVQGSKDTEEKLLTTINELETSLKRAENMQNEARAAAPSPKEESVDWESEKAKHLEQVAALQKEIDGYKSTADSHATKLLRIEESYAQIMKEIEEDAKTRELTETELKQHKNLVANLEGQIDEQKSLVTFHQQGLKSLQESQSKEIDDLKAALVKHKEESKVQVSEQHNKHKEATSTLQDQLTKAHMEMAALMQSVSVVLEEEADGSTLHSRIQNLADERKNLAEQHSQASKALEKAEGEIQANKRKTLDLENQVKELTALNEDTLKQLEHTSERERRSTQLVQDLEDQLQSGQNQTQKVTDNLTSAKKRSADVEKELEEYRGKVTQLENQIKETRRMTQSSQHSNRESQDDKQSIRKSSSHASLPSPPPAVPLPPLPGSISSVTNVPQSPSANHTASPPASRHTSKELPAVPNAGAAYSADMQKAQVDELEKRLATIEKHLNAEKQLTQTLEEALLDLETQANKTRAEADGWKKKCREVEEEASGLRRERGTMRNSIQAVEEERDKRIRAEAARRQLEERMEQLGKKKKNKATLNCF